MVFLEISQNSKNTTFTEHLRAIASEMLKNLMILNKTYVARSGNIHKLRNVNK